MGSDKAVIKAKEIITNYFDNLKGKNSKGFMGIFNKLKKKRNENILTAINALKEFYSRDQSKILDVHNFLNKQIEYKDTPKYIVDAVLKDTNS